ncbi:Copper Transporter integral membrane protein that functions in high affinity copper transport [Conoideocrella luteorostrata]|uniref:Copper transport protein n=1 Tax=Conoideocrella luteorostrata TaxID=1105319 RepID=A0AAJ0G1Z3_9HYPO|nr:Copper Transporter integral membrane protein that functions in high affinity copper transport [Conoideocrella luteorostrata]
MPVPKGGHARFPYDKSNFQLPFSRRAKLTVGFLQMLWNWYTIDACFLSPNWHITNNGMFAATCIGVILLVMLVEFFRRLGKEYDAFVLRQFQRESSRQYIDNSSFGSQVVTFRATFLQQIIRSVLHALTFGSAYIVMLLAMYFNGYVIICIFIGAGLGKFFCDWLEVKIDIEGRDGEDRGVKGIEEPSVCCG